MAQKTSIEWTESTWNPLRGCSRISPGCGGGGSFSGTAGERGGCYAEAIAARFSGPGQPFEGFAERTERGPRWTGTVALIPEMLDAPLRRRKPTTYFISMSDLFHEALMNEEIAAVFGIMAAAHWHTFQILTKRADRLPDWFAWTRQQGVGQLRGAKTVVCTAAEEALQTKPVGMLGMLEANHTSDLDKTSAMRSSTNAQHIYLAHIVNTAVGWPLRNVHLGVSVESCNFKPRIDYLRQVPAAVRFLSLEPLLEDLGELDLAGIDQVIAGSESGHGARPMHDDWVRSIRDQATAQGVRFFFKQKLDERGHKVSLPLLDGRSWSEMPARPAA